jgi:hypothetical protein
MFEFPPALDAPDFEAAAAMTGICALLFFAGVLFGHFLL